MLTTIHPAVVAADRFLASLTGAQQAGVLVEPTPALARAWSNLPQRTLGSHRRPGLSTSSLSAPQWDALLDLLAVVTGSRPGSGLSRVRDHLDTDDHLHGLGGRWGYGRGEFVVALLGRPSLQGTWQLQLGGHHLALVRTFRDGRLVSATPSFRGVEPFGAFQHDGRTIDAERSLRDASQALLDSLDTSQARDTRLPRSVPDLLLGAGHDGPSPRWPAGISARELDERQRDLLIDLIEVFVHDAEDRFADQVLADYRTQLLDTFVSWAGSRDITRAGTYLRVDGPRVWIEISVHEGIVLRGPHPHAIWRDKTHDYGGMA